MKFAGFIIRQKNFQSETRESEVTLGENIDLGTIDLNPIEE